MDTIDKIFQLMEQHKITANALSVALGLKNNVVFTQWKNRKSKPSADALLKIADYFNVSVDYLLGRTDDPRIPFPGNNALPHDYLPKGAVSATEYDLHRVPIIGSVRAGFGSVAEEDITGYDYITSHDLDGHQLSDFFFLTVKGDSMEPELHAGDRLLIRRQASVDSGALAVVMIDNEEGTVKRIKYGRSWIELISINPDYPPRIFENKDVMRITVIGLVTKAVRLF